MANIIDLDALIPEQQVIRLDGRNYELQAATVGMYLQVLKERSKWKHADDEVQQTEQAVGMIVLACPGLTRERLERLPLKALMRISKAIEEQMTDLGADTDESTTDRVVSGE